MGSFINQTYKQRNILFLLQDNSNSNFNSLLPLFKIDVKDIGKVIYDNSIPLIYELFLIVSDPDRKLSEKAYNFLRSKNKLVPIIIITKVMNAEEKFFWLEMGVNDIINETMGEMEIKAHLQYHLQKNSIQRNNNKSQLTIKDISIDFEQCSVTRAGIEINLSKSQFDLFNLLIMNTNIVLKPERIAEMLWEEDFDRGTNAIEVAVKRLRDKIDKNYSEKYIHTKRGFGYMLKI